MKIVRVWERKGCKENSPYLALIPWIFWQLVPCVQSIHDMSFGSKECFFSVKSLSSNVRKYLRSICVEDNLNDLR